MGTGPLGLGVLPDLIPEPDIKTMTAEQLEAEAQHLMSILRFRVEVGGRTKDDHALEGRLRAVKAAMRRKQSKLASEERESQRFLDLYAKGLERQRRIRLERGD